MGVLMAEREASDMAAFRWEGTRLGGAAMALADKKLLRRMLPWMAST